MSSYTMDDMDETDDMDDMDGMWYVYNRGSSFVGIFFALDDRAP